MKDKPKILGGMSAIQNPFPAWPQHNDLEIESLIDTVKSGEWWKKSGSQVKKFEADFAASHDVPYGLAITNGTHAIELALRCLDIGPGDEVIIPALTFIATASPIIKLGAKPVPVDVRRDDWCMDATELEKAITDKTRAIMPVHFAGQIARMEDICKIAQAHDIPLIEDAAHVHGGKRNGQKAGTFGVMAIFSFQNYKLMTAGEGGFLTFTDKDLFEKAKLIYNCGRPEDDKDYQHVILGDNFRMSEFQAAVLNVQLRRLDDQALRREANAAFLIEALNQISGITMQIKTINTNRHSYYMLVFEYDWMAFGALPRVDFIQALEAEGVPAYRMYPIVQDTPFFESALVEKGISTLLPDCPNGRILADTGVWIHHRVLLGDQENATQLVTAIRNIQKYAPQISSLKHKVSSLV